MDINEEKDFTMKGVRKMKFLKVFARGNKVEVNGEVAAFNATTRKCISEILDVKELNEKRKSEMEELRKLTEQLKRVGCR